VPAELELASEIPVVELFGHKFDLCSKFTWEKILQPLKELVK
jgi:hypothetical protein